jgi:hypothetical protein
MMRTRNAGYPEYFLAGALLACSFAEGCPRVPGYRHQKPFEAIRPPEPRIHRFDFFRSLPSLYLPFSPILWRRTLNREASKAYIRAGHLCRTYDEYRGTPHRWASRSLYSCRAGAGMLAIPEFEKNIQGLP